MLRSLIRQLSHQSGGIPAPLKELYGGGHEQPSVAALQAVLTKIAAGFERTYIVIDALDECTDREKLMDFITDVAQQNIQELRIMVSSRAEPDILHCVESIPSINRVLLAGASTNDDIETYVDAMLSKITRWNKETRERVKTALMSGADGM